MKLKYLFLTAGILTTSLISCNSHKHNWKDIVKPEYYAGRATYTHGTEYYKSCPDCGAVSKETFTGNDKLTYTVDENPEIKDANGMAAVIKQDIIKVFIDDDERFKKYTMHYDTYNLKNERIRLSAAVVVPFIENGEKADIKGFVIDHHPTITGAAAAPTKMWTEMTLNVVTGCVVLQPDLLGLGDTVNQEFDYHCRHLSDRNAMDAALATQQFILDKFKVNIADLKTFNVGYSQGGYDSLSFLRYMEQEATNEEKDVIHIDETYSGSGAYNIQTMFDNSLSNPDFTYTEYVLMGVMSTHAYHPDAYGDLTVDDYLTDLGKELHAVLNEKDDDKLKAFKDTKKYKPKDIFVKEYLEDKQGKYAKAVERAAAPENLLDGNWKPAGTVWLFYPVNDDIVTTECSKQAIELFKDLDNVDSL